MQTKPNFFSRLTRRGLIRLVLITVSIILVLGIFSAVQFNMAKRYSQRLQYDYEQQLDSLSVYLSEIDNGLKISSYISTPEQFARVSSAVWQNCGSAKGCIAALPTAIAEFDNTYRFLSQAGEYMKSLSVEFSKGNEISSKARKTLKDYSNYASQLCTEISDLRDEMESRNLWDNMAYKVTFNSQEEMDNEYFYSVLAESEGGLSDIPDPVYNGPFSSHITNSSSKYLEELEIIEQSDAAEIAAKVLGVEVDRLTFAGESSEYDKFTSFRFETGLGQYAAITKKGGKVAYFLKESYAEKSSISEKQALTICLDALNKMGYDNLKATHYTTTDSVMTAEFCRIQNGVVCLTDVIKVGIEMDSSKVFAMDARQYLLNTKPRSIPEPQFKKDQALQVLSSSLTMQSVSTVIIPSDNVSDTLCYQFICRADDNTNVIVYINCNTLEEEKIILIDEQSTGVYL